MMRRKWRNPLSYLRVTIGLINQQAQASAYIPERDVYTYYSDLVKPMDNYKVQELYATCDQDYTTVDGSMYFLPKDAADVVLNQGIVTDGLKGEIEIRFPVLLPDNSQAKVSCFISCYLRNKMSLRNLWQTNTISRILPV